jgi:pimeloyl-ACP methyl ester carboxylesterase
MIDRGKGIPIVLIPGLQGRWEWMRPAVDALSKHHRVISYSLCDERTSPFAFDERRGFDNYVEQVAAALDRARIDRAVIAGVSFGGLIAKEFAARHPERVNGLVLASALHSSWQPDERQRRYLQAPTLMSPLFVATAPGRMRSEVLAALPTIGQRLKFGMRHAARVVLSPTTPSRMARRITLARSHQFTDALHLTAPVLVVTGEPGLDRVVPVDVTRRYLREFASAEHVVLEHTGHIGLVTRPDAFAGVLERFVNGIGIPA